MWTKALRTWIFPWTVSICLFISGLIFVFSGGVIYETVKVVVADPDTVAVEHHHKIVHHHSHTVVHSGWRFGVPPFILRLFHRS